MVNCNFTKITFDEDLLAKVIFTISLSARCYCIEITSQLCKLIQVTTSYCALIIRLFVMISSTILSDSLASENPEILVVLNHLCFNVILFNPESFVITSTQIVLRLSIPLLRGFKIPCYCLLMTFSNPFPSALP